MFSPQDVAGGEQRLGGKKGPANLNTSAVQGEIPAGSKVSQRSKTIVTLFLGD